MAAIGLVSCVDPIPSSNKAETEKSALVSLNCELDSAIGTLGIKGGHACPGEMAMYSITLEDHATAVDALTLDLAFDPDLIEFSGWRLGALNPGWIMADCREVQSGVVRLLAFAIQDSIAATERGDLFELDFKIICHDCEGRSVEFQALRLLDDLAGMRIHSDRSPIACD